jgi:hypothetical protein
LFVRDFVRYLCEIDIVLPPNLPLKIAHDIGEALEIEVCKLVAVRCTISTRHASILQSHQQMNTLTPINTSHINTSTLSVTSD